MVRACCIAPGCHRKEMGVSIFEQEWTEYAGQMHQIKTLTNRRRGLDWCEDCSCSGCLDSRDAHTQNTGAA